MVVHTFHPSNRIWFLTTFPAAANKLSTRQNVGTRQKGGEQRQVCWRGDGKPKCEQAQLHPAQLDNQSKGQTPQRSECSKQFLAFPCSQAMGPAESSTGTLIPS